MIYPHSSALIPGARRVRQMLTVVVVALVGTLAAERLGYAGAWRGDVTPGALASQLLFSLPAVLQLAALWQLRQTAAVAARGEAFGPAVVRGLRGTGVCLVAGSAAAFLMPLVHHAMATPYPRSIEFDVAAIILAGVGAGLVFLAALVRQAGEVQSELDAIF